MIMRSVLANFLSLGTTQTGSRALGSSMRDFFYLSLEAVSRKIDETISNTSIRRLVNYNYGGARHGVPLPYPRLVTSNIVVINPLELLEVAKDVGKFDVDLLQPDDDMENWIRKKCGMPLKSSTPRARWAPIQTRLEEQEEGAVPIEPGTKLDAEGKLIAQGALAHASTALGVPEQSRREGPRFDCAHGSTLLTVPEQGRRDRPEPVEGQSGPAALPGSKGQKANGKRQSEER
jgi:hypothetical protein